MNREQSAAIVRAIQTVEFIEPCPKCASRERLALARLLIAELDIDQKRQLIAEIVAERTRPGDAEVASWSTP